MLDSETLEAMKTQNYLTNEIVEDDRGYVAWKVIKKNAKDEDADEILYTEELVAMILRYGKYLSELQAGGSVKDCVITIPSYFNH